MTDTVGKTVGGVTDTAGNAGKPPSSTRSFHSFIRALSNIPHTVSGVGDTVGNTAKGLTNTVGDTTKGVGNTAKGATDSVGETAGGATGGSSGGAKKQDAGNPLGLS